MDQRDFPRDVTVPFDGGVVAARDYGGRGDAIVLLHGNCGSAADWDLVGPLVACSSRVVAVDLRGHGQSVGDPNRHHTVSDIGRLVREFELGVPLLVGHSASGCFPAMAYAAEHPARGIVNLDAPVGDWAEVRQLAGLPTELASAVASEAELWAYSASPDEHERYLAAQGVPGSSNEAMIRRRYFLGSDNIVRRRPTVDEYAVEGPGFDVSRLAADLRVPMLVLLSSREQARTDEGGALARAKRVQADTLARHKPVTVVHLASGHSALFEEPAEVARHILAFSASHSSN